MTTFEAYQRLKVLFPGKAVSAVRDYTTWWEKQYNGKHKPCKVYIIDSEGIYPHGWSDDFATFEELFVDLERRLELARLN